MIMKKQKISFLVDAFISSDEFIFQQVFIDSKNVTFFQNF